MSAVEQGVLVVADIGGYTRYVSGVELDHSHDILADLIGVVADRLGRSLPSRQAGGRCRVLLWSWRVAAR